MNKLKSLGLVAVSFAAPAAFAQASYDDITDAVDWSAVITGVGAIAALLAAVMVFRKGAKMLISFLR
jgi:hypothetical protein